MKNMYEIGTNFCESFTLGNQSQSDDFYLSARMNDNGESEISGRIFDSNKELLFEIVNNNLTNRSKSSYRRVGFHDGWKICDSQNNDILSIITEDGTTPLGEGQITRINGNAHDKNGELMFEAGNQGLQVKSCSFRMS